MSSPTLVEDYYHDGKVWGHTSFIDRKGFLTWKISGFSVDSYEPGEFVASPQFSIVGDEENTWYLHLYPGGQTAEGKDFVAVFFYSMNRRKISEPVTCIMCILDASGARWGIKEFTYDPNCSSGLQTFISKSDFSDHKDLLLPNNALTVCCDLMTIMQLEKIWISGPNQPRSSKFNFPSTVNTLSRDIGELYKEGSLCDVVLKVDETKIPAHKAVLTARSSRFAIMFKQQNRSNTEHSMNKTCEHKKKLELKSAKIQTKLVENNFSQEKHNVKTVVIKDVAKKVLMMMLDYIYTNECHLKNVHSAMELLTAADRYCIPQLLTLCSNYLNDELTENNVLDIVQVADTVSDIKLRKTCIEFICHKLSNLKINDSNWKSKLSPGVISDILLHVTEKEKRFGNFAVSSTSQSNCSSEPKTTSGNSQITMRKTCLVWKLSDFRLCPVENGRCLYSPQFGISGESIKYHLEFYPNGISEDDDGCLSLSLHCSPQVNVSVQFSICIRNGRGTDIEQLDDWINFYKNKSYRWNKCVSREKLDSCLSNDLIVVCVVGVSKSSEPESVTHTASLESKPDSRAEDFGRLFESKEFADVILKVEANGPQFPEFEIAAHKTILRSRSSVLACMLNVSETKNSIKIPQWDEGAFRQFIAFLYTDQCSFKNVNNALHVWVAAHKFKVPLLQVEGSKYLCEHISDDSVLPIMFAASIIVHDENIYKNCIDYIVQEVPSFTFLPSREEILSNPDIYNDILECFVTKVDVEENRQGQI